MRGTPQQKLFSPKNKQKKKKKEEKKEKQKPQILVSSVYGKKKGERNRNPCLEEGKNIYMENKKGDQKDINGRQCGDVSVRFNMFDGSVEHL